MSQIRAHKPHHWQNICRILSWLTLEKEKYRKKEERTENLFCPVNAVYISAA
jgi:hypothetical protein